MSSRILATLFFLPLSLAPLPVHGDDVSAPRRFTRVPAPEGVQIRRFNKTEGESPEKGGRVTVHYHGTLPDGRVFDSTRRRGRPASFRLDGVIECWKIALPRLRVGEKAEIICPPDVAYGGKGSPPTIPGNARLKFEVELLGVD